MLPVLNISTSFNKGILRQYAVAIISTIGLFMGGTSIGWPNPVVPQLLSPDWSFPITREEISWIVAIIHVAFIISSAPTGYLMDKFGRKKSLLFLSIFPLSSWILILFSTSTFMLYIARFLAGVWLGSIYTIVPMYIAEIAEPQIRGSIGNFTSLMTNLGTLFVYIVGSLVSYHTLAIICGIIPVIFMCTFVWMPESPYYYLMHKQFDSAKKSLMWLRDGDEVLIESELTRITKAVALEMKNTGTIKDILATKGSTAIIAYASVTLPSGAFTNIGTNGCVIIIGAIGTVSCFVLMFLIDRINRKPLLFTSCFGCGCAMLVLAIWYYLYEKTNIDMSPYNYMPFYFLALHGFLYSIALGPIVNSIKGELFPSNVKAIASIITTIVLASGSFIVNKMYLIIADAEGFYVNFIIFCVISLLGAIFTVTVVVETRGKTLQDIQIELNGGKIEKDENEMKC